MGTNSRIEWTRHTHNPWIGCAAVSAACDHCYAERLGKRFGVAWGAQEPRRRASEAYRRQPFTWDRAAAKAGQRHRVFSASLADIWDNAVLIEWLMEELDTIRQTPNLDWLLLTKRPQLITRRLEHAKESAASNGRQHLQVWIERWIDGRPPDNVRLGTTTETQEDANRRVPLLFKTPARSYFVSAEPLLGGLNLRQIPMPDWGDGVFLDALAGRLWNGRGWESETDRRIGWVITGGESGPGARASHPDWFRRLRDQCHATGAAFFFKQWGEWAPADAPGTRDMMRVAYHDPRRMAWDNGAWSRRLGKKAAGALLDGREWRETPA